VIIATAGHVDHGKTSLVRALTGIDTDRLEEEKRRGMSIDLGFAYVDLGAGEPVGFVDVPGHERFIRNMLAGVAAIDFALLVVAADDGPMPQTAEHLAILNLLGIGQGAVALTKIDRVDAARIAAVTAQIRAALAGSGLHDAPIFPLAGPSGLGVPALRQHLAEAAAATVAKAARGNFRLAIDRSFTVAGAGLVVTGAVFSGAVAIGDRLMLSPQGVPVRVRGIHAQNQPVEAGQIGQRCAVNIAGTDLKRAAIGRGDWLLAEALHHPTDRLDVNLRLLATEPRPLNHWTPVHVHLGAMATTGRVAVLAGKNIAPGDAGLAQLVLDQKLGALHGDRLILRDQSAQRTIAGGLVLDPFAPTRGRARPERLAILAALERPTAGEALQALLTIAADGVDLAPFAQSWNLTEVDRQSLLRDLPIVRVAVPGGEIAIGESRWAALRSAVLAQLALHHRQHPDHVGPDERALRQHLPQRLAPALFHGLLQALLADGAMIRDGLNLRLPQHRARLAPADQALWQKLQPLLQAGALRPPRVLELAAALHLDAVPLTAFLRRAARLGYLLPVAENRFYPPSALAALANIAEALAATSPERLFNAAEFRDRSGIGRNLTIEVLEFFDKAGFTRRAGNQRRILRPVLEVFGAAEPPKT